MPSNSMLKCLFELIVVDTTNLCVQLCVKPMTMLVYSHKNYHAIRTDGKSRRWVVVVL